MLRRLSLLVLLLFSLPAWNPVVISSPEAGFVECADCFCDTTGASDTICTDFEDVNTACADDNITTVAVSSEDPADCQSTAGTATLTDTQWGALDQENDAGFQWARTCGASETTCRVRFQFSLESATGAGAARNLVEFRSAGGIEAEVNWVDATSNILDVVVFGGGASADCDLDLQTAYEFCATVNSDTDTISLAVDPKGDLDCGGTTCNPATITRTDAGLIDAINLVYIRGYNNYVGYVDNVRHCQGGSC